MARQYISLIKLPSVFLILSEKINIRHKSKWLIRELTGRTVDFVMAEQSH